MNFNEDGRWRRLELNGGEVRGERPSAAAPLQFYLPPTSQGYADAQIDDYGPQPGQRWQSRRHYPWRPGVRLTVQARFSHPAGVLLGTAGFGFWNAPFGDPTIPWPALPQAAWFFYGSPPNNLPLAERGPGRGWFAATLDVTTWRAKALAPLALPVLLLNQIGPLRRRLWPWVRQRLGIAFAPILHSTTMTTWRTYRLDWLPQGCRFAVDGRLLLQTSHSPQGPLGFVCWLDNQYLILTPRGRFGWGTLKTAEPQWLELAQLSLETIGA